MESKKDMNGQESGTLSTILHEQDANILVDLVSVLAMKGLSFSILPPLLHVHGHGSRAIYSDFLIAIATKYLLITNKAQETGPRRNT